MSKEIEKTWARRITATLPFQSLLKFSWRFDFFSFRCSNLSGLTWKMAKGSRGRRRSTSRPFRSTPYSLPSCRRAVTKDSRHKKCFSIVDKRGWEGATCTVCMECPHNAVLLLCSSHDKGCRPYMCGTSFRYSNCLAQYIKAYSKAVSSNHEGTLDSLEKCVVPQLSCPLCRGEVKGWTVVEPARKYLNVKKRSCMQDDCSFVGTFKELRKHMKSEHPSAQPRKVDPTLEQKWRRLEQERDWDDMVSIITSTMSRARVLGDNEVEVNLDDSDTDAAERNEGLVRLGRDIVNFFLLFQAFGLPVAGGRTRNTHRAPDENAAGVRSTSGGISLFSRIRQGRYLGWFGRRHRESNESQS